MNKELELHDSKLAEVRHDGSSITLCFDKAIVHHSQGEPGVDSGTCWLQKIDIFLDDALLLKMPDDIPNDIDFGHFFINSIKHVNMISTAFQASGKIEVELVTFFGNKLHIKAKKIKISEIGEPEYLQKFETKKTHNKSVEQTA
jgi:hypothetical protein